jgi:FAD/FMN-containing dehydrogenase/Fe-S oxidoreductase
VDERRARIYDDLRGIIEGELYFEPLDRAPHAHDASIYEIDPLGVIVPRSSDDVIAVVRYAAEHRIPIHPRGSGTDTGGGSLGSGLVIDFSRHMRQILELTSERVTVEPGVLPDQINRQLAHLGCRLEPVCVNRHTATLGGLIAVDSAGSRSLCYGTIGDQVESLRVVLASGDESELGFNPWPAFEQEGSPDPNEHLLRKLHALYRRGRGKLERLSPDVKRNRAGYALGRAASDRGMHLGRLVAGSEGTLAIILQATLRTTPLPAAQGVLILPFLRLADAASFVPDILEERHGLTACDLHDRRSLSLAHDANPLFVDWIHAAAESILIVEYEADDSEAVAGHLRRLAEHAMATGLLVSEPTRLFKRADCELALDLRRVIEPLLMNSRTGGRPVALFDDIAVPPDRLASVLFRIQTILRQHDLTWTLDSFAGDGRLRFRPLLDLSDPGDRDKLEPLATRIYDVVLDAGGTVSASQALGLARTQFLRKQAGELLSIFREIKDAFDPLDQLNPGKVIGDDPALLTRSIRQLPRRPEVHREPSAIHSNGLSTDNHSPDSSLVIALSGAVPIEETATDLPTEEEMSPMSPALRWTGLTMLETASSCNGCGDCRTLEPTLRMCPSFRALRREDASPRSQANLIRQVASGSIDPRLWGTEEFKARADLCIHCKLCRTECPSGVDVSALMLEAKAAFTENHGIPPGDWIFSRMELWARIASRLPIVTNFLLGQPRARWVIERLLNVSRHRALPNVRRTPFTRRAAKLGLHKPRPHQPGPRVVYFVDIYANYYDHELAEAVVAVLHQAEVNVYVPIRQRSSGMEALIVGDIDYARELAHANLRVLANAVRDGYTVVCSEPTAALMLRQEYVRLTEDLDAELVAANTMDIGDYLEGLDARGNLPAPREPLRARVGYHQPCHLRALGVGTPGLNLIRKLPDIDVEFIDRGCSGMGGTYGLARERFRNSLRAGRGLLRRVRDTDIDIGSTECGACRIQMEQGAPKRTLHPIKLLSLGYGLNPSLREHFKDPKPRNIIS